MYKVFLTDNMHILTTFNQTNYTGTSPLTCYNNADPGKYLNDSDSYNDNDSDCRPNNYNNYESNYESDNKETPCTLTSTIKTLLV